MSPGRKRAQSLGIDQCLADFVDEILADICNNNFQKRKPTSIRGERTFKGRKTKVQNFRPSRIPTLQKQKSARGYVVPLHLLLMQQQDKDWSIFGDLVVAYVTSEPGSEDDQRDDREWQETRYEILARYRLVAVEGGNLPTAGDLADAPAHICASELGQIGTVVDVPSRARSAENTLLRATIGSSEETYQEIKGKI